MGWYLNLVKKKALFTAQRVNVPTINYIQRKNQVRTMTYAFGFYSVLYGMGSIRVIAHFLLLGSVLGKTWVLVRFILAEFGFFPISNY